MPAPLPLTAKEISLMLRSGYSNEGVLSELSARRFADRFDSTIEKELIQAGANQALIDALRSGTYQLSPAEIAAAEKRLATQASSKLGAANLSKAAVTASPASDAPPSAPREVQMGGTMYDHLKDDLIYLHNGALSHFDDEVLEKKKFYLLFFSAISSPEGRKFTAHLVDYYNRVSPEHPEFEVIFFSADRSRFAMENYMTQTNMPWPAVDFDKRSGKAGAIQGNLVSQIPTLILADSTGRILSYGNSADKDAGPEKVLADLSKILRTSNE